MEFQDFFPHTKIREGQQELVNDVQNAFSNKDVLLAHAPTGLGKTASVLSVAMHHAITQKKKVFFLTNRHTQHKIAIDTLRLIKEKTGHKIKCVDLIGKKWMCLQPVAQLFGSDFNEYCKSVVQKGECEFYNNVKVKKGITVPALAMIAKLHDMGPYHNEEVIELTKDTKMCSYEMSLILAKEADVVIGDYNYIFNGFVQSTLFNKLELSMEDVILIVDEGHNLPLRVADMMSSTLSSVVLNNAVMEAKKYRFEGMVKWLKALNTILEKLAVFEDGTQRLVTQDEFTRNVKLIVPYETLVEELENAAAEVRKKQRRSYLGGIATFLDAWLGNDVGFARILSRRQARQGSALVLQYLCLDPSIITKDIFSNIHAGVIMSGTLNPTVMYKDLLGIQGGICKQYESPFPPENKLALIVPETSTKYNLRTEQMFKKMADITGKIAAQVPGNIALFFPSYDLRDKVCAFFESKKHLFYEKRAMSKDEKEKFLSDFKDKKEEGAVLLGVTGANFAEGVDFPGDLLQGVIVIGLPLARPDLKTKETIKYYDSKFGKGWDYGYIFPAMNKCVQSAGRCIRSGTDTGVIIYLDERFAWQKYYSCLPRERLIVSKEYEKYIEAFLNQ